MGVVGYRLNRLDEPVFMAGPKPMLTEFGIHQRLESCALLSYSKKSTTEVLGGKGRTHGVISAHWFFYTFP